MLAGVKVLSARFTIFDFLSFYTYRIFCRHLQQRTKVMKRRRGMLRVGLGAAPVGWFSRAVWRFARTRVKGEHREIRDDAVRRCCTMGIRLRIKPLYPFYGRMRNEGLGAFGLCWFRVKRYILELLYSHRGLCKISENLWVQRVFRQFLTASLAIFSPAYCEASLGWTEVRINKQVNSYTTYKNILVLLTKWSI